MGKRVLTDRTLKSLKPAPSGKAYDVWDATLPNFGVRVNGRGKLTFIFIARFVKFPTRRSLGVYGAMTLEQAREKARHWHDLLRKGIDPAHEEEKQRQAILRAQADTFSSVAEKFIEFCHRQKQRKAKVVERDIRREFIPRWGARPVSSITKNDVITVVDAAVERNAPYQAHNLLGHAKRLFNWAIGSGRYGLESSPCDRLKPKDLIGRRAMRTRVLTDEDLRAFWRATGRLEYPWRHLYRLLLITIQRKSDLANAVRSELNVDKALLTIPAERMKMDAPHIVPLSSAALDIFQSLPTLKGPYLFSTTFGQKPVGGFSKLKARLDKLMLEELRKLAQERGASPDDAELKPWVVHDLRRTGRTALSALPVGELVRELVIAHQKPGLHKVYDQYAYLDEKRQALELWAARLRDIVEPPPANVVALDKARA